MARKKKKTNEIITSAGPGIRRIEDIPVNEIARERVEPIDPIERDEAGNPTGGIPLDFLSQQPQIEAQNLQAVQDQLLSFLPTTQELVGDVFSAQLPVISPFELDGEVPSVVPEQETSFNSILESLRGVL